MTQTTLINDIYGVVGSQGEITDLNVDGRTLALSGLPRGNVSEGRQRTFRAFPSQRQWKPQIPRRAGAGNNRFLTAGAHLRFDDARRRPFRARRGSDHALTGCRTTTQYRCWRR